MPLSQDLDVSNGMVMCSEAAVFADGCTDLQDYYDTTKPGWFVYGLVARQPELARALLHTTFADLAALEPPGELKDLLGVAGNATVSRADVGKAVARLGLYDVPIARAAKKFLRWVGSGKTTGARSLSHAVSIVAEHTGESAYGQWLRQQVPFDVWKVGIDAQP